MVIAYPFNEMDTLGLEQLLIPASNGGVANHEYDPKDSTANRVEEIIPSDSGSPASTSSFDPSSHASLRASSEPTTTGTTSEVTVPPCTINYPRLISSPYLEPYHLLDLTTLDIQSSLLAQALTHLDSATPTYATAAYSESLNWAQLFRHLRNLSEAEKHAWATQVFYVVEFRSKLKQHIDQDLLFNLDKYSHAEANISGGLLKYWYGSPDAERRNLATCELFSFIISTLLVRRRHMCDENVGMSVLTCAL